MSSMHTLQDTSTYTGGGGSWLVPPLSHSHLPILWGSRWRPESKTASSSWYASKHWRSTALPSSVGTTMPWLRIRIRNSPNSMELLCTSWTCSLACGQYVKPLTCRNSWFSAAGRLLAASNIFCSHGSKFLRPWALVYCAISLPYVLYLYISYIYTCDDMCVGIPDSNLQLLSWLQYYCALDWRRKIHDLAPAIKHPSFYYNLSNCTSVNTIQGLQNPTVEVWKQTRAKQDLHTFDCLDLDGPLERPELSKNQLRCLGMFGADHVMTSKTTPLVWT